MTKILLIISIFFLSVRPCFSQWPVLETREDAWRQLKKDQPDSIRQYSCNFLATFYFFRSGYEPKMIDSSFYYSRKAVYMGDSLNIKNSTLTNESLFLLAQAYLHIRNLEVSRLIFLQVVNNYRRASDKLNEARIWRRIGKEYWIKHTALLSVPAYFDSAILLFGQAKASGERSEVIFDKMNMLSSLGNTAAAGEELKNLLAESIVNDSANYSLIYSMLAKQNRYEGNLNIALGYALKAMRHALNKTPGWRMHNYYGELAQIYQDLGEVQQSIYWYKKCITERQDDRINLLAYYRTISMLMVQMIKAGKAKEALEVLKEFSQRRPPKSHEQKGSLAQSFAYCYAALRQFKPAETKFLEMSREYSDCEFGSEFTFIANYDVAKFYVDFNEFEKATPYLATAKHVGESSVHRTRDLYLLLFKADSAKGNFQSAIQYYQRYKLLNDSIFTEAKSKQINELMIQYESEKKDDNIHILEKESSLQQAKILKANQTRNWVLGAVLLLSVIIGLLLHNSRIKQRTNKQLRLQQEEIREQNTSLQHLVEEKEWLMKEIHHRVKNNFHTVIGLLGTQSGYLKNREAIDAMAEGQQRIQAMSLIHQKLYQSENMSDIDMPDYIHELADYLQDSLDPGRRARFHFTLDRISLGVYHAVPLGLILNEAITNAIKYAFPGGKTGNIHISFTNKTAEELVLEISDDGNGLPEGFDNSSSTMGMNLMRGLAKDIDAKFSIESAEGTRVKVMFNYADMRKDKRVSLKETSQS